MKRLFCIALIWSCLLVSSAVLCAPKVLLQDVRISVEPAEGLILVKEMITMKPMGQADEPNADGIIISLPNNAMNAALGEDIPSDGITLKGNGIHIKGPIPAASKPAAVSFYLGLSDGRADRGGARSLCG
jgi:hypothetical protein